MKKNILDVIVIGAGHAGLSLGYYLKQSGMSHIIFEKGQIGDSWRSQRWDSFVLNTPHIMNTLPGEVASGNEEEFQSAEKYLSTLNSYVSKHQLNVAVFHHVVSVDKAATGRYFIVTVLNHAELKTFYASQVVICSGSQTKRKVPAFAANLSSHIKQLHTSEYRNVSQLPAGGVLVVGGGQSGCQIAEDLAMNGKKVYLSTSKVGRLPRCYRGKDVMEWLMMMKFFSVRAEDIVDPEMKHMTPPQLTGADGGKTTLSLQSLARKGVTILGRMEAADGSHVTFQPDAAEHVKFADAFSQNIKNMIDQFIQDNQVSAPVAQIDPADLPDPETSCASAITELDLDDYNITSVIWTTGFSADFGYIRLPVLDAQGWPVHNRGMSSIDGLYFLGLYWLRDRKSGLLGGMADDAEFISVKLREYSRQSVVNA